MRLTVNLDDVTIDIESENESPTFDEIETLLNRAADVALRMWWDVNGEDDNEMAEVLDETAGNA